MLWNEFLNTQFEHILVSIAKENQSLRVFLKICVLSFYICGFNIPWMIQLNQHNAYILGSERKTNVWA